MLRTIHASSLCQTIDQVWIPTMQILLKDIHEPSQDLDSRIFHRASLGCLEPIEMAPETEK